MLLLTNSRKGVIMSHKNDYTCIAYFPDKTFKKWTYVHGLYGFSQFLNSKHPTWLYFNVYERRTGKFIERFSKGSFIPNFLHFLILLVGCLFFLTFKTPSFFASVLTFNDFNNTATIWILKFKIIGGLLLCN